MPEFQLQGAASSRPSASMALGLVAADGEPRHAAAESARSVCRLREDDLLLAAAAGEPVRRHDSEGDHADDADDHAAPVCCLFAPFMVRIAARKQDRAAAGLGKTATLAEAIEASLRHRRQRVSGRYRKAGLWPRGARHLRASGVPCVLAAEPTAGQPADRAAANSAKSTRTDIRGL